MPSGELNGEDPHGTPFIVEALVSAGPRKSLGEYESDEANAELCEDCAGFCWVSERLIFWLCDGASKSKPPRFPRIVDKEALPERGFSARILAKDLGLAFSEEICRALLGGQEVTQIDLPTSVFAPIAAAWDERFRAYAPYLGDQLDQYPEFGEGARRIDWSSTFSGGVFDPRERRLDIINIGPSGALVMGPWRVVAPNLDMVTLRAWLRLVEGEGIQTSIEATCSADVEWEAFSQVEGFAVVSDGMERYNLGDRLKQLQEDRKSGSLSELRSELLRNSGLTFDDRAIIYGRFLGK